MNLSITLQIFLLLIIIIQFFYHDRKIRRKEEELKDKTKQIREDAIKASKSVMTGKIAEEIVPLMKDFPYNIQDIKFLAQPIDYIIYEGMSELRNEGTGKISIIFADVKSNNATTSKIQKGIKEAIEEKRIRWETWNVRNGEIKIK